MPNPAHPPGKRRQPQRRRLNPDAAPFNQLPLIAFEPDNEANQLRETEYEQQWEAWLKDPVRGGAPKLIPAGTILVLRGDLDITTLNEDDHDQLRTWPRVPHVVFTNRIGQHTLHRSGHLLPLGIDPSRGGFFVVDTDVAPLEAYHPDNPDPGELTEYAANVRRYAEQLEQHAARLREAADQYDLMAADGWELTRFDAEHHWGFPLRDTKPGSSFAPRPRR